MNVAKIHTFVTVRASLVARTSYLARRSIPAFGGYNPDVLLGRTVGSRSIGTSGSLNHRGVLYMVGSSVLAYHNMRRQV